MPNLACAFLPSVIPAAFLFPNQIDKNLNSKPLWCIFHSYLSISLNRLAFFASLRHELFFFISVDTILEYNQLDADDPQILSLQLDPIIAPEIRELSVFLDRYDTEKGVICLLIWSSIDQALVCLPSLGLQPYPLCWKCNSKFGTVPCPKCGIAKYCSSTCLVRQNLSVSRFSAIFLHIHRRLCSMTKRSSTAKPVPIWPHMCKDIIYWSSIPQTLSQAARFHVSYLWCPAIDVFILYSLTTILYHVSSVYCKYMNVSINHRP